MTRIRAIAVASCYLPQALRSTFGEPRHAQNNAPERQPPPTPGAHLTASRSHARCAAIAADAAVNRRCGRVPGLGRGAGYPIEREASVCEGGEVQTPVEFRRLARAELSRIAEIDRTERIDLIYEQRGTDLVERHGNWSSPAWDPDGHGEHSVEAQRRALEHYVDAGGVAMGAFSEGRLVGIAVVVPHLRPEIAQLAFLHVSEAFRAAGVGRRLSDELDVIARP
jgi:hypothetical protein